MAELTRQNRVLDAREDGLHYQIEDAKKEILDEKTKIRSVIQRDKDMMIDAIMELETRARKEHEALTNDQLEVGEQISELKVPFSYL